MKRIIIMVMLIVIISITGYSKVNFFIDLAASQLKPADTKYADIYGTAIFYPELMTGIKVFNDLFIYGGYGFIKSQGDIIESGNSENATSKQSFISLGLGYEFMSQKKISLKLSGGIMFVNYEGETYLSDTLIDNDSGNKTGYKFDIGIFYNFPKYFTVSIITGYFHAQNTEDYYRKLSYGGLKVGLGLGVRF